jgi:myo-inositol-1(or 4)-monophosphatase
VIRYAGGAVADWNGAPLSITSEGSLIACGDPGLLPQVLASLHATG